MDSPEKGCTDPRWRPVAGLHPSIGTHPSGKCTDAATAQSFQAPFINGTYIKDQLYLMTRIIDHAACDQMRPVEPSSVILFTRLYPLPF